MRSVKAKSGASVVVALPAGHDLADAELVERALAGDRWAEQAIYLRHAPYVTGLCTRLLLRAPSEVQDVVQDTFVDVLEQLSALRERHRLRHWITGIAVHKVHRRFRRWRLSVLIGLTASTQAAACAAAAQPGLSPEQRAELARLDAVLGGLDHGDRACWLLRYAEGYTLTEVAELCGCSLATAKRRIGRAHERVRAHVHFEGASDE